MLDFTVAIRAYNAEKYLPSILNQLEQQIDIENINWEIIVIDNNSTDNTVNIVKHYQAHWDKPYPLKYFFEEKQGAYTARQRAIDEAQAALIGFLDYDNIPALDWVAKAYSFSQSHPQIGAYGGKIHGEFEVEPPKDFDKIAVYLAIINRGNKAFCYNNHKQKVLPPGAGIVISKKAWLDAIPNSKKIFLLGPNGQSLLRKGEDIEVLSYIQNAGWEIWYNPQMHISHKIPAWRLERDYLISLAKGIGLNRHYIRMIRIKPYQRPFAFFLYLINDLRKVLLYGCKNYSLLKTNTIVAFEMTILISIFISPFNIFFAQIKGEKIIKPKINTKIRL